jgi:CheY-like chemotaxis protein
MSLVADWFKKRNQARPAPKRRRRILVVAISLVDRVLLEQLGRQHDWEIRFTNSANCGFALAEQSHFELILCDRNQVGFPWREVIRRLAAISPRSCILLVSPVNMDYVWQDVLQQGGYDVLIRPLREKAVLDVISAAERFLSTGHSDEQSITK